MRRAVPLAFGVLGAIATALYALHAPDRAAAAWTAAFSFGLATALSALALVFALHLSHAKWWLVVRRPLLACAGTTPLYVALFVPIALSMRRLYPWARGETMSHRPEWDEPRMFLARAVLYLAIFTALAVAIRRVHARFDATADDGVFASARRISGAGAPLLAFAATFASFDWLMSTQADWSSDMLGLYVLSSGLVAATSVLAIGAARIPHAKPDHLHATGRLLFMSVILWAYIGFFQLLLLWIADEPREISFYRARSAGSWAVVDIVLVAGRFAFPFLLLLSRRLKRSRAALSALAIWLLATTALEHAWFVIPSSGARLSLFDLAPFVCVAGLAWAYGAHLLRGAPDAPDTASIAISLRYESP